MLGLSKMALLAGSADARSSSRPDIDYVVASLSGDFDSRRQFEAANPALKIPPSVAGRWLDRQYASMHVVSAPALGARVVYLEWRSGGRAGQISRQRLWAFDGDSGTVRMRFYSFKMPDRYAGRGLDAYHFRTLMPDDLIGYPSACAAHFSREGSDWVGRIDPADCRIVAGSGRGMRLDVTIRTTNKGFAYQEAGILDSGVKAFAVPPGQPYQLDRVRSR